MNKIQFFSKSAISNAANNELYIYDSIGEDSWSGGGITAQSVSDSMKLFTPNRPLDIFINSSGGSVFDGMAIYNQIGRWAGKKTVYVDGIAASIASVIAMCGDEICMAESSSMMIHEPSGMAIGTSADCRQLADALDKIHDTIVGVYAARTGMDKEKIGTMMKDETWISADEAMEMGFCTKKTMNKAMKAESTFLNKYKHTPQNLRKESTNINAMIARAGMGVAKLNA